MSKVYKVIETLLQSLFNKTCDEIILLCLFKNLFENEKTYILNGYYFLILNLYTKLLCPPL